MQFSHIPQDSPMQELFPMLEKRKSVRKYDENSKLTKEELDDIEAYMKKVSPLYPEIKIAMRITERKNTGAKFGEYCILFYSEEMLENVHLQNAGYMLEQLDLYIESKGFGACWLGLARPDIKQYEGLKYVIMLTFGRAGDIKWRRDFLEYKRLHYEYSWEGSFDMTVPRLTAIAPSAMNNQPWYYISRGDIVNVCRKTNMLTKLSAGVMTRFNSIDMGIALCFFDVALCKSMIKCKRTLCGEEPYGENLIKVAQYERLNFRSDDRNS